MNCLKIKLHFGRQTRKLAAAIWRYCGSLFVDNKSCFIHADFNCEKVVFGVPTESDNPVCSTPSRYDLNRQFILFCGSHTPLSPSQ